MSSALANARITRPWPSRASPTPVHFQYTRIADWPPLAWLARCLPFERAIEVFHGDRVEITPDWFCEAIWAGPYDAGAFDRTDVVRSEEHTSELQSHSDLVCRLLLEKKK